MSSASKTIDLLGYFSTLRPEIGLSQLCRLAQRDKATTYRQLQVLEDAGFVEQNDITKRYRLGPALLHLGHVREVTVPRKEAAMSVLTTLADQTGETAHVSVLSGVSLHSLASVESQRYSARVMVDRQILPLHATASGLAVLAFGPTRLLDGVIADMAEMDAFTEHTPMSAIALNTTVAATRACGFGHSNGFLDPDTRSLAAPVFDPSGACAGAVSVACLASRYTPQTQQDIKVHLQRASRQISTNWGGSVPTPLEDLWSGATKHTDELEPTA